MGADDEGTEGGRLDVWRYDERRAVLVPIGTIPDTDGEWLSLNAWENAEGELIATLGLWLTQRANRTAAHGVTIRPGAYRVVCTDRMGEMCTVDLIHGVDTAGGPDLA